jgi:flagella basal body P-ring formation protein FlgA
VAAGAFLSVAAWAEAPALPATEHLPVATHTLTPGTVVAAGDVAMADVSRTLVYPNTARTAAEVVGLRLNQRVESGRPFNTLQLKAPAAVERNSAVRLVYKRPGLELAARGLALEAGNTGAAIRVLNTESRATLLATITGPGTVTVGGQ